jgi:hypothetical protein
VQALNYDTKLWAEYGQVGSNVTLDGRFLVFKSIGDLTPDDTSSGAQIFEYDSQTEQLVRVSVGQNGFNDDGNTGMTDASIVSPNYTGGFSETKYQPGEYFSNLSVSEDGSYVFFQSGDGLTPQAVNLDRIGEELGSVNPLYANNVYEYHSVGGDIADGNVYLISDGKDVHSYAKGSAVGFRGTDVSGRDVFFESLDRLVPQDTNEGLEVYDARIGGGFPAPAAAAECAGDACQGAPSAAPVLLSPGSELQSGGNPLVQGSGVTTGPSAKPSVKGKATKKKAKKAKKRRKKARSRAKKASHARGRVSGRGGGRS